MSRPSPIPMPADTARYDNIAISFHWLLALMIVGSFCVGLYMSGLPFSIQRVKLFNWHKWAGMTILALTVLRLLWRLRHPPPPEAPGPHWQQWAAKATHRAMYALCLAIPLVGWAYSSAAGFRPRLPPTASTPRTPSSPSRRPLRHLHQPRPLRQEGRHGAVRPRRPTGKVDITIDMTSVNTGVAPFDKHLRSKDFFDVPRRTPPPASRPTNCVFTATRSARSAAR
jgi:cytochrome b561